MRSLDKLTLNNKIVEMRKDVKRSRIQSINKLVKEIKKLKEKKGTEEQKAKNKSKVDRLIDTIKLMNKIEEDDISKFALINEKTMVQITNDVNESPEIKAIARIINHRPIHEQVKSFREQFPNWKEIFPILFDTLGERYQNKKKSKKNVSQKKNKMSSKKNKSNEKIPSDNSYVKNKSGIWLVQTVSNPTNVSLDKNSSEDEKIEKIEQESVPDNSVTNISSFNKEGKKSSNIKVTKKTSKDVQLDRKSSTRVNEKHPIIQKEVIFNDPDIERHAVNHEKVTKIADPFFVTKDNKEYLSVNVANSNEINHVKDTKFKHSGSSNDYGPKSNYREKTRKEFSKLPKQKDYNQHKEKPNNQFKDKPRNQYTDEVALHPSWEAKKRQSNISQFQGKKIKFDD